jgi:hypothetical protein
MESLMQSNNPIPIHFDEYRENSAHVSIPSDRITIQ